MECNAGCVLRIGRQRARQAARSARSLPKIPHMTDVGREADSVATAQRSAMSCGSSQHGTRNKREALRLLAGLIALRIAFKAAMLSVRMCSC